MEGTATQVDFKAMAPEHLVREANAIFQELRQNQGLPGPMILERLEPVWVALVERVEAINTT